MLIRFFRTLNLLIGEALKHYLDLWVEMIINSTLEKNWKLVSMNMTLEDGVVKRIVRRRREIAVDYEKYLCSWINCQQHYIYIHHAWYTFSSTAY